MGVRRKEEKTQDRQRKHCCQHRASFHYSHLPSERKVPQTSPDACCPDSTSTLKLAEPALQCPQTIVDLAHAGVGPKSASCIASYAYRSEGEAWASRCVRRGPQGSTSCAVKENGNTPPPCSSLGLLAKTTKTIIPPMVWSCKTLPFSVKARPPVLQLRRADLCLGPGGLPRIRPRCSWSGRNHGSPGCSRMGCNPKRPGSPTRYKARRYSGRGQRCASEHDPAQRQRCARAPMARGIRRSPEPRGSARHFQGPLP